MNHPIGCGIDFGTTNSSIAVAYDDETVEVVAVERTLPREILPSLVFLHRSGTRLAGEAAVERFLVTGGRRTSCQDCALVAADVDGRLASDCQQFREAGRCLDGRLIAGIKSELANLGFTSTHSWARDFTMEDLVEVVIRTLKDRAERHVGESLHRVVIGRPVAFPGTGDSEADTQDEVAEERLTEAARRAGFSAVSVYPEPLAALVDEPDEPGVMASVDFGGGTFDIAIVRIGRDGVGEVESIKGASVGGQDLDAALFTLKVEAAIGLNDTVVADGKERFVPAEIRKRMQTLAGLRSLLNDPQVPFTLASLRRDGLDTSRIEAILFGGYAYDLYRTIEEAKIALSREQVVSIRFRRPGLVLDERVTRVEFESAIRPCLETVDRQIGEAIAEAEIAPEDVTSVVRTGGSAQLPAFADLLRRRFPNAELRRRPVFTSVARGLAVVAGEEAMDG